MKQSKILVFAFLLCTVWFVALAAPQGVQGQIRMSRSVLWTLDNRFRTYSETFIVDFTNRIYYIAGATADVTDEVGRSANGSQFLPVLASVTLYIDPAVPGLRYVFHSRHYLRPTGNSVAGDAGDSTTAEESWSEPDSPSKGDEVRLFQNDPGLAKGAEQTFAMEIAGPGEPPKLLMTDILIGNFTITADLALLDPIITGISPSGVPQGRTDEFLVRLTGENLQQDPATNITPVIEVTGTGVTARPRTGYRDLVGLDCYFTVAEGATIGDREVKVHNTARAGEKASNAVAFRVGDRSPVITGISRSQANAGEMVTVVITGLNFGLSPLIEFNGPGILATYTNRGPTQITAVFSIDPDTIEGDRGVKVRSLGATGGGFTPTPGTPDTSNTVNFLILGGPKVTLPTDLNSVEQGGVRSFNVLVENTAGIETHLTIIGPTLVREGQAVFDSANPNEIIIPGAPGTRTVAIRIKGVKGSVDTDNMKLKAVYGNKTKEKDFSVAWVEFLKNADCDGFDDRETTGGRTIYSSRNYLLVGQNVTRMAKARVRPSGAAGDFRLASLAGTFTVTPNVVSSTSSVDITVMALGTAVKGDYTLEAKANIPGTTLDGGVLVILVRPRIQKNVVVWRVIEDNDDVQDTPVGSGSPNRVAFIILPGPNNVVDSIPGGDDFLGVTVPGSVPPEYRRQYSRLRRAFTGQNGIVETTVSGDDIMYVPAGGITGGYGYTADEPYQPFMPLEFGGGVPFGICVSAGVNRKLDTLPDSDDREVSNDPTRDPVINSGPNGRCQTRANATDTPSGNPPSVQAIEDYVNQDTWGKQANVFIDVNRVVREVQINFDFDRDGLIKDTREANTPASPDDHVAITGSTFKTPGAINLYYIGMPYKPYTFPDGRVSLAGATSLITPPGDWGVYGTQAQTLPISAHELGHNFGANHRETAGDLYDFRGYVMYPNTDGLGCRTGFQDWQEVQP